MTTAQDLIRIDIIESSNQINKYSRASSLPPIEKRKNKPEVCHYRRDRVLHRIMQLEMERALYLLGQPARKGGE